MSRPVNTFTSRSTSEDRIGRGGPDEWLRVGVGALNVLIDVLNQLLDAAKRSATNGLLRDPMEPNLHLVQPRGIGRSEVHPKSWPGGKPAFRASLCVE